MRKIFCYLIGVMVMVVTVVGFAATKSVKPVKQTKPAQPIKQQAAGQIKLYAAPNQKRLIRELPITVHLVSIYRQGDWVKVGDPRNGQVGWVNIKQYRQAKARYYRPNIQTFYVQMNRDNQGKPTWNIVAYRNGKPLPPKEAKKLYQKLRQQSQQSWRNRPRFTLNINRMIDQDIINSQRLFDAAWSNFPMVTQPVIIIPRQTPGNATLLPALPKPKKQPAQGQAAG